MVDVNIYPGKAYLRGDSEDASLWRPAGPFCWITMGSAPPPDYLGTATAGIVSVQRHRNVISGS